MKLFIRSVSLRPGLSPTAPWVVKDELVKKYSLPSKFADIFMSPKRVCYKFKLQEISTNDSISEYEMANVDVH